MFPSSKLVTRQIFICGETLKDKNPTECGLPLTFPLTHFFAQQYQLILLLNDQFHHGNLFLVLNKNKANV